MGNDTCANQRLYDRASMSSDSITPQFWQLVTRLGEIQILVPAALLAMWLLARQAATRNLAAIWLAALLLATTLTTLSKIAFIGWCIGSASLNFTGISGHTMYAAAIYPLVLATLAARLPHRGQVGALIAGCLLALMVGVSRLEVGAHSVSEVMAGLLLGYGTTAASLSRTRLPRVPTGSALAVIATLWLLITPLHLPSVPTHALVTRLALSLSGYALPCTRRALLNSAPCCPTR